jgi:hypothetical protein
MNALKSLLGETSSLWTSLIALILVALVVVLAFNALQGRQRRIRDAMRRKAAEAPAADLAKSGGTRIEPVGKAGQAGRSAAAPRSAVPAADDVVAASASAEERVEPTLGALPEAMARAALERDAAGASAGEARTSEDVVAPAVSGSDRIEPELAPTRPPVLASIPSAVLDPRIDCIVEVKLAAPIAPDRILQAGSAFRRAGTKPVVIEADTGSGAWEGLHAEDRPVQRLRVGLLLSNRQGPLNAMEFDEFADGVGALAQTLGASETRMPDMDPVLEHARQVDDFCAQLDSAVGINIQTPSALPPAELAVLAESLGLSPRGNNRFARLGDGGNVLFTLSPGSSDRQITLLLDVPRALKDADPWQAMVDCARRCAAATGGQMVDDAMKPLSETQVAAVARQLAVHYESLDAAGLGAGSPAALRVFN